MKPVLLAYITFPDLRSARAFSRRLLTQKVVACTNILPQMESHFVWKGKLQTSKEVVMIAKTFSSKRIVLEKMVTDYHPYDCPCILYLTVSGGFKPYLDWMRLAVR